MKKLFTVLDGGCSRRTMLQGIGTLAAAALVPAVGGCTQGGSDLPSASTSTCANGVCIDLTQPANAALAQPGGAMLVDADKDTIMVIRVSATEVIALSAICTHAGCSMNFDAQTALVVCPCHGSEFDETGHVVHGPARTPLKVYTASVASDMITVAA
jgi:Rieske Fe-S protein